MTHPGYDAAMRTLPVVLALAATVAGSLAATRSSAQEAPPADTLAPAVEHAMRQLVTAKTGLRLGMKGKDAPKAFGQSAHVLGTHAVPLGETQYGAPGARGVVMAYMVSDEPDSVLDEIHVAILCEPFDRKALAAAVVAAGEKLGIEMEEDEEEDGVWSGWKESPPRTLSISLAGKGVVLIEASAD